MFLDCHHQNESSPQFVVLIYSQNYSMQSAVSGTMYGCTEMQRAEIAYLKMRIKRKESIYLPRNTF